MSTGMAAITRFVRELDGNYYRLSEAAEMLGVSQGTLRNYIHDRARHPELAPTNWVMFGKVPVYLYNDADIERIRKALAERRSKAPQPIGTFQAPLSNGRPRKWTPEQVKTRNRLYTKANYYRNRVAALKDAGAPLKKVKAARAKLREIEAQLKEMEA